MWVLVGAGGGEGRRVRFLWEKSRGKLGELEGRIPGKLVLHSFSLGMEIISPPARGLD